MNLTQWAFDNNRVTLIAVLLLTAAGLSSYFSLPKAQDPGFTIRVATVTTFFPGASPVRVEQLITNTLEEKIQEMPELDELSSESRNGISVITVEFQDSYDEMQPIFDDLRRKVEDVTPELPSGSSVPVVNDEYGDVYGHLYHLYGADFSPAELSDYADLVRDELLKDPDVAKVDIYGELEETIYVDYQNARLTELGISPQQLADSLSSLNILSSGGDIVIGDERVILEPSGNYSSVADLSNSLITVPSSNALIRLGDIAEVYRDYDDPAQSKVRVNGTGAISLAISMRDGGNILNLGDRLTPLMAELEAQLPLGVTLQPMFRQSDLTANSVNSFVENLIQAVLIVVVVMVVSLGTRTGIVVASLIPVVMISTFFTMAMFDIGIDQISLAALIIALGLLVDNAIVVVEAVTVRREDGEDPIPAAIAAANEMKMPLLISSLTTCAAFTPIALAQSAVGEFTQSIFYVVTMALLISWVMSMTFIPMLTPLIKVEDKSGQDGDAFSARSYVAYRWLLRLALRNRTVFSLLVLGLFFVSIFGLTYVPQVFIPPSEDPILTVAIDLPTGTDIDANERLIEEFEQRIESGQGEWQHIQSWTAYIGSGGPRFVLGFNPVNPNAASTAMILSLDQGSSLTPVKDAVEDFFFEDYPSAQVQVKRLANGPPFAYPIEIKLRGRRFDELFSISDRIKAEFWSLPEVTAISDTWGLQSKKLAINIDQARASRAGVTNLDIATSLDAGLSGLELTEYREGEDVIPVVLRTRSAERQDYSKLENTSIFSQASGSAVPLSQVADIGVLWEPARIERLDRERMITIEVQLAAGVTATEVSNRIRPWLEEYALSWPAGYGFSEGGENEESEKASSSIAAALPFAVFSIVLLLVVQFNSVRRTGIVLITIPLGLIGIVAGLLITGASFGFFTLLGLISLAGIVINNAIVLLDRVKLEIDENGMAPKDAIVAAAQQRARPILLTTSTTIGGMIPLWLGGGPMFETMAIAILFGLLFATLITLVLVPVLYSLLFRVSYAD
ncbi:MAG: efflux RND transporter permease subunit [Pseudomonadota bacterium]